MAYIDLSRAFDSVRQDTLYKLLQRIGCPGLFMDNIRDLLNGLQAEVSAEGMLSAPFFCALWGSTGMSYGALAFLYLL